jgi:hypothetical protein
MENHHSYNALEKALLDFKQHLPEASTCPDDIITEIIIVGNEKAELQANRVRSGNMYMWNIRTTTD